MPHVSAYDPAFAYEMAALIRRGMDRMHGGREDILYYLTIYNEPMNQPREPEGLDVDALLKGLYQIGRASCRERV